MNTSIYHGISIHKFFFILVVTLFASGCKKPLYTNLTEVEANEMMSVLIHQNIDVKKITHSDGTLAIAIDEKRIPQAVSLLKQQGLPKKEYLSMGEIFQKDGLISSPLEEKARFLYAMSESIADTLTEIDGVITAKVHIVLPENDPFSDVRDPSSASVYIKYNPIFDIENNASKIKMIVEKSVSGLEYNRISLVMLPASIDHKHLLPPEEFQGSFIWGIAKWASITAIILLIIIGSLYFLGTHTNEAPRPITKSKRLKNSQ